MCCLFSVHYGHGAADIMMELNVGGQPWRNQDNYLMLIDLKPLCHDLSSLPASSLARLTA
jgi:hypothetical protein